MYNKTVVKPLGVTMLKLINPKNKQKYKAEFMVVEDPSLTPILGSAAVQQMKLLEVKYDNICAIEKPSLLTVERLTTEYKDVFSSTGKLAGQYHIDLDETVKPVVHPPRKVPVGIKE